LENAVITTVEQGSMTKDLAILVKNSNDVRHGRDFLNTEEFMEKVDLNFQLEWAKIMS
jgi:isocitrate dehydrogenase